MHRPSKSLRDLMAGPEPLIVPLALNPMMAKLAEHAGFEALYLGGGSMGYLTCVTEANLTLTEMAEAGLAIKSVSGLPLILDAAAGWGDPMHIRRTIALSEAAGFAAIEIEDQILPKRAHHHIGIEHVVPLELMVAKIEEAVAVRKSRDFLIIARTNAARSVSADEAIRRGEALHKAGADVLFIYGPDPEQTRTIAKRLPGPLMTSLKSGPVGSSGMSIPEMFDLGYRLFIDMQTPLLAMHHVLAKGYAALRAGRPDPTIGTDYKAEQDRVHETIGLDALLEVERRTVER
jgi:2-methylisocitrate lyase-like PEP mutase family enzyme